MRRGLLWAAPNMTIVLVRSESTTPYVLVCADNDCLQLLACLTCTAAAMAGLHSFHRGYPMVGL